MVDDTDKRKGAPTGSIDALATALGLFAEQASDAPLPPARPPAPEPAEPPPDLRLAALGAIDARLGQIDAKIALVEAEITRSADASRRAEAAFDQLRDDLQRQAQTLQRAMLIAVVVLALAIVIGHFI
jgi:hypothetical protein